MSSLCWALEEEEKKVVPHDVFLDFLLPEQHLWIKWQGWHAYDGDKKAIM